MNRRLESRLFWGFHSPLSSLCAAPLIIMASSRFSFALVCTGALIWVYGLTTLIFSYARPILPNRGKIALLLFLSSFLSGFFMLLCGLLNPMLILGMGFFLILIPPSCLGSGFFEASETAYPLEAASRAVLEAVVLGTIIMAVSLIREPLGMGTLSFPGGPEGIMELFSDGGTDSIALLRILSVSSGGLLLFGYIIALFRYFKESSGSYPEAVE